MLIPLKDMQMVYCASAETMGGGRDGVALFLLHCLIVHIDRGYVFQLPFFIKDYQTSRQTLNNILKSYIGINFIFQLRMHFLLSYATSHKNNYVECDL